MCYYLSSILKYSECLVLHTPLWSQKSLEFIVQKKFSMGKNFFFGWTQNTWLKTINFGQNFFFHRPVRKTIDSRPSACMCKKREKVTEQFLRKCPLLLKMAVFGNKMAAKRSKSIQSKKKKIYIGAFTFYSCLQIYRKIHWTVSPPDRDTPTTPTPTTTPTTDGRRTPPDGNSLSDLRSGKLKSYWTVFEKMADEVKITRFSRKMAAISSKKKTVSPIIFYYFCAKFQENSTVQKKIKLAQALK